MYGIYGGAFDPFHLGHISAIKQALQNPLIDSIIIVPSYKHPYGKKMIDYNKRVEMIKRVIADNKTFNEFDKKRISVSTIEFDYFQSEMAYTYKVLDKISSLLKEPVAFITGSDNDITKFLGYDNIVKNHKIVTVEEDKSFRHSSEIKQNIDSETLDRWVPQSIKEEVLAFYQDKSA